MKVWFLLQGDEVVEGARFDDLWPPNVTCVCLAQSQESVSWQLCCGTNGIQLHLVRLKKKEEIEGSIVHCVLFSWQFWLTPRVEKDEKANWGRACQTVVRSTLQLVPILRKPVRVKVKNC